MFLQAYIAIIQQNDLYHHIIFQLIHLVIFRLHLINLIKMFLVLMVKVLDDHLLLIEYYGMIMDYLDFHLSFYILFVFLFVLFFFLFFWDIDVKCFVWHEQSNQPVTRTLSIKKRKHR